MYAEKENKLTMCAPCCNNCPEAFMEGNMIVLTDDNEVTTVGIRKIKLTKDQFHQLMEQGKKIIR